MPVDLTIPGSVFKLEPVYQSFYREIVRPHLRFTVSRYFAERWVPTLGLYRDGIARKPPLSAGKAAGAAAWLVVQMRQVVFWHNHHAGHGIHSVQKDLGFLSRESGLSSGRILKMLNEPLVRWFIERDSGEHKYDPATNRLIQETNKYRVLMDDPLIPADAEHLYTLLKEHDGGERTALARSLARVEWALAQEPQVLRASSVRTPLRLTDWFSEKPVTVLEILQRVEPGLRKNARHDDEAWIELLALGEQLSDRVVVPKDEVGEYYYFRKNYVRPLGTGPAWAIVLLRDKCFDHPEKGYRDTDWLEGTDWLADRIGIDRELVGIWLRSELQGFVRILEQKKGAHKDDPQRVRYKYWIALRDPLTPKDNARYLQKLGQMSADESPTPNEPEVIRESAIQETPVLRESTIQAEEVTRESGIQAAGVSRESAIQNNGDIRESAVQESGVIRENLRDGGGSYENTRGLESLNIVLEANNESSLENRESSSKTTAPLGQSSAIIQALSSTEPVAVDIMNQLLVFFRIQNPNRQKLIRVNPPVAQIVGWALYHACQPGLDRKQLAGFLVSIFCEKQDGPNVPPPFDQIGALSPERWTEFAIAARQRAQGALAPWGLDGDAEKLRVFEEWYDLFGSWDFDRLPYGLGKTAAAQWQVEQGERSDATAQAALGSHPRRVGKWVPDYG